MCIYNLIVCGTVNGFAIFRLLENNHWKFWRQTLLGRRGAPGLMHCSSSKIRTTFGDLVGTGSAEGRREPVTCIASQISSSTSHPCWNAKLLRISSSYGKSLVGLCHGESIGCGDEVSVWQATLPPNVVREAWRARVRCATKLTAHAAGAPVPPGHRHCVPRDGARRVGSSCEGCRGQSFRRNWTSGCVPLWAKPWQQLWYEMVACCF